VPDPLQLLLVSSCKESPILLLSYQSLKKL
jgi:hypothetical protein